MVDNITSETICRLFVLALLTNIHPKTKFAAQNHAISMVNLFLDFFFSKCLLYSEIMFGFFFINKQVLLFSLLILNH